MPFNGGAPQVPEAGIAAKGRRDLQKLPPSSKASLRGLCNSIDAQIFPWYPKLSRYELETPGLVPGAERRIATWPRARAGGVRSGRFWRISLELHKQA